MTEKKLNGDSFLSENPYDLEDQAQKYIEKLSVVNGNSFLEDDLAVIVDSIIFILENIDWVDDEE